MLMNKMAYEEKILYVVRALPEDALPKVLKLLVLMKDEFLAQDKHTDMMSDEQCVNHAKTQQLLGSSRQNWAYDVIAERVDRI